MTECRGGKETDLSCAPDVLHSCKAADTGLSRLGAAAQHTLGNWRLGKEPMGVQRIPLHVPPMCCTAPAQKTGGARRPPAQAPAAAQQPAAPQRPVSAGQVGLCKFQTLGTEVAAACTPLVSFSLHTPKVWDAPTAGLHSHKGGNACSS